MIKYPYSLLLRLYYNTFKLYTKYINYINRCYTIGNISRTQANINRDNISRLIEKGLSPSQIIEQLQIDRSTYFRYVKQLRARDEKIWEKVEIDNAKYRALSLLRSFEETVRVCTNIANSERCSNKDRIEARKAVDMANAHIFRLVHEGPMFNTMPEVKRISDTIPRSDVRVLQLDSTTDDTISPDNIVYHNKDNNKEIIE